MGRDMFYQDEPDEALRFGDVLKGFILTSPNISEPAKPNETYSIDVYLPAFSIVMSPCCSIGDKMISLTPLIRLRNTFFNNPYLSEDLTRINREMEPEQTVPPDIWNSRLSHEEKQRRLGEGRGYAFLELFVYEKHDLFPEYTINRKQGNIGTRYYMIDFRNTYKVNCQSLITPTNAPLDSKCLQLSIEARAEMRDKISYYYARVPKEDRLED